MSCLHVHDFVTGTTITLPHSGNSVSKRGKNLDIVRPNSDAAALVADHLARITATGGCRTRPSKITAIAC